MHPPSRRFDHLKPEYDRDGFVVVRELLPEEQFSGLRRELDRYIAEVVPRLPDSDAFYIDKSRPESLKQLQRMQGDPYFLAYARHPVWNELARVLVGEAVEAQTPEWFNKPPGFASPTPPHQDNYYVNLSPPHVVTIWLALDRVDEENGCLRYVRGSQLRGVRPHGRSNVLGFSQGITDYGPADIEREVTVPLQPGDAVAHHGNTIHRADPNNSSSRQRRSFAMVFRGLTCRRDEAAFARYLDGLKSQHEQLGLAT
jgi:phytanoyl-CoA hydroxylase